MDADNPSQNTSNPDPSTPGFQERFAELERRMAELEEAVSTQGDWNHEVSSLDQRLQALSDRIRFLEDSSWTTRPEGIPPRLEERPEAPEQSPSSICEVLAKLEKRGLRSPSTASMAEKSPETVAQGRSSGETQTKVEKPKTEDVSPQVPAPVQKMELEEEDLPLEKEDEEAQEEEFPENLAARTDEDGESLELKMGRYWFVRVGIVMLLTGFAFLATLAYRTFYSSIGPAGRLSVLFLAGGALVGLGHWLERRREQTRQFGQVLLAGGLAEIFFSTYASHHIEAVKVIDSPTLAGMLLLGWTAVMIFIADRRRSEILGCFGTALAYYTCIINPVALFSLFSTLLLTLAGIVFLFRHRWLHFSYTTLAGTYGAFAYWRFVHDGHITWQLPMEPQTFWIAAGFLATYWALFSYAVLASENESWSPENRLSFLTANNGATVALASSMMPLVYPGHFWILPACMAGLLLALMGLANKRPHCGKPVVDGYLVQALLMLTWSIMAYFSGARLALTLGIESVALMLLGWYRANPILRLGGCLTALASALVAMLSTRGGQDSDIALLLALAFVNIFNTSFLNRHGAVRILKDSGEDADDSPREVPVVKSPRESVLYAILAAEQLFFLPIVHASGLWMSFWLLLAGGALTLLYPLTRSKALTGLLQFHAILGLIITLPIMGSASAGPLGLQVACVGIPLVLIHLWFHPDRMLFGENKGRSLSVAFASLFIIQWGLWSHDWVPRSLSSLGLTGWLLFWCLYGALTRTWSITAAAHLLILPMLANWLDAVNSQAMSAWLATLPVLGIGLLSAGFQYGVKRVQSSDMDQREWQDLVGTIYRLMFLGMALVWVFGYIPARWRFMVLVAAGLPLWLWGGMADNVGRRRLGLGLGAIGVLFVSGRYLMASGFFALDLLVVVALLAAVQFGRREERLANMPRLHWDAVTAVGCWCLWGWTTRWIFDMKGGFLLTVGWATLAFVLIGGGLLFRDVIHRRAGLVVLMLAMTRILILDLWTLTLVYRILGFMALGVVLVVLGFVYNRYATELKRWL